MAHSHASINWILKSSTNIGVESLFYGIEGEDDPKAFPLILDELLARTMALRVKVQPSYNQSSVIRHFEDPNLIKTILDQIVIFQ
ncbi:hypothetical protein Lal_00024622, partial [Lupinus albus]